jgi:hypothetical protein
MRKLVALVAVALVVTAFAGTASTAAKTDFSPGFGVVKIAGGTYGWANGVTFLARYAKTPSLKLVVGVIRACPGVKFYGFLSFTRGAGVVGWLPTSLRACLPVVGGGPGAPGCFQAMKTPYPDPDGLSGLTFFRWWVLVAATSDTTCRDLSTQVKGGIWTTTNATVGGLPAGSVTVIRCQQQTNQGLWDFVAPYTSSLPASKWGLWIADGNVNTKYARWYGVPSCWG